MKGTHFLTLMSTAPCPGPVACRPRSRFPAARWLLLVVACFLGRTAAQGGYRASYTLRHTIHQHDLQTGTDNGPLAITGLNGAGLLVGYGPAVVTVQGEPMDTVQAFAWNDATGTLTNLGAALGAEGSLAACVNAAGQVAGVFWTGGTHHQTGFRWQNGVATTFQSPEGGDLDAVVAMNASGQVVGTYLSADSGLKRAFLWDGTQSIDLGGNATTSAWPVSINDAGQVAGTAYFVGVGASASAFRWQNGTLTMPDSNFSQSAATGLNASGEIVGTGTPAQYTTNRASQPNKTTPPPAPTDAFDWFGDDVTDLGSLGGNGTLPFGVDDLGWVTGTGYALDNTLHLFDWRADADFRDQGSARLLASDTRFQLTSVNARGDAAGFVLGAQSGDYRVFVRGGRDGSLVELRSSSANTLDFYPQHDEGAGARVLLNDAGLLAASGRDQFDEAVILVLTPDADGDGLPDGWTAQYLSGTAQNGPNDDPDGDGLTNLEEFEQGTDPKDFFQGQAPVLTALGGTPQTGAPGGFVPQPLVAQVTNVNGTPTPGTLVSFQAGTGQIQASSSAAAASTISLSSDAQGQAQVFYRLPTGTGSVNTVTATASAQGRQSAPVTFTLSSDDGTGSYPSPFDVVLQATANPDDSGTLAWTHRLDGVTGFRVSRSDDGGGSWTQMPGGLLPATATGYTVAAGASEGIMGYSVFKVEPLTGGGGNSNGSGGSTNSGGGTPAPAPALGKILLTARYAVIDLGLTSDVGRPVQINNNGTVLLAGLDTNEIHRWRQGNMESLGSATFSGFAPPGFPESYAWTLDQSAWLNDDDSALLTLDTSTLGDLQPVQIKVFPAAGEVVSLPVLSSADNFTTGATAMEGNTVWGFGDWGTDTVSRFGCTGRRGLGEFHGPARQTGEYRLQ